MQQIREYPQFPQRFGELLVDLCEGRARRDGCNDRSLDPFEPQMRSHEVLRRGIVQLAGDALPLFLLKREQLIG